MLSMGSRSQIEFPKADVDDIREDNVANVDLVNPSTVLVDQVPLLIPSSL